jgi:hypothetical protein
MMAEPPPKKKKTIGHGRHQKGWENLKGEYEGWIKESKNGAEFSYCIPCQKDIKVSASGFYDLTTHFGTKKHKENVLRFKSFKPINQHFTPGKAQNCPTSAEVIFAHFLAEHNIPPTAGDHFTDLVRNMFPDSTIAQV